MTMYKQPGGAPSETAKATNESFILCLNIKDVIGTTTSGDIKAKPINIPRPRQSLFLKNPIE